MEGMKYQIQEMVRVFRYEGDPRGPHYKAEGTVKINWDRFEATYRIDSVHQYDMPPRDWPFDMEMSAECEVLSMKLERNIRMWGPYTILLLDREGRLLELWAQKMPSEA